MEEKFLSAYREIWEFPSQEILTKESYEPCPSSQEPIKLHSVWASVPQSEKKHTRGFLLLATVYVNTTTLS